jgi:hypothetical protein
VITQPDTNVCSVAGRPSALSRADPSHFEDCNHYLGTYIQRMLFDEDASWLPVKPTSRLDRARRTSIICTGISPRGDLAERHHRREHNVDMCMSTFSCAL